ncbi:hypothetical protein DEO72_LG7g956 [Vigna unguiculata]|uniref:Uncharacterized protein n=1 Tax=Vigna unguiculata TaxID=3917 RepID=A0A4D6MDZ4_VIGUN|nr:hypothetical protein DEO72_LG7g956 [Vigna unguiculata]
MSWYGLAENTKVVNYEKLYEMYMYIFVGEILKIVLQWSGRNSMALLVGVHGGVPSLGGEQLGGKQRYPPQVQASAESDQLTLFLFECLVCYPSTLAMIVNFIDGSRGERNFLIRGRRKKESRCKGLSLNHTHGSSSNVLDSICNALLGLLTTALGQASSKLSLSSRKLNLNPYCFPSRSALGAVGPIGLRVEADISSFLGKGS